MDNKTETWLDKVANRLKKPHLIRQIDSALAIAVQEIDEVSVSELQKPATERSQDGTDMLNEAKRRLRYEIFYACTGGLYQIYGLELKIPTPGRGDQEEPERVKFIDNQFSNRLGAAFANEGIPTQEQLSAVGEAIKESDLGQKFIQLNEKARALEKAIDDSFEEVVEMMKDKENREKYNSAKSRVNLITAGAAVLMLAAGIGSELAAFALTAADQGISFDTLLHTTFTPHTPFDMLGIIMVCVALLVGLGAFQIGSAGVYKISHEVIAQEMLQIIGPEVAQKAMEQHNDKEMLQVIEDAAAIELGKINKMQEAAKELQGTLEGYKKSRTANEVSSVGR